MANTAKETDEDILIEVCNIASSKNCFVSVRKNTYYLYRFATPKNIYLGRRLGLKRFRSFVKNH